MIDQVTINFSPAFAALPYALLIQFQMLSWLNNSFPCNSFKAVSNNADVYIFMDTERNESCGKTPLGSYIGCHYPDGKIVFDEGLFGLGAKGKDWHYAWNYRRSTVIHEFIHQLVPYLVHTGNEMQAYEKAKRC